jgi:low affinity Fe/Cu permease
VHRGSLFDRFARHGARFAGHPLAFAGAVLLILIWLVSGPVFAFSNTWQLVINTATTIVTFLMVFVIQNTQNRDGEAVQIKLDELIRAIEGAHNSLLDLEELSEDELQKIREEYLTLAEEAREEIREREGEKEAEP